MNPETYQRLKTLGACSDALEWIEQFPNAQAAWDACEEDDWMDWVLRELKAYTPIIEKAKPLVSGKGKYPGFMPECGSRSDCIEYLNYRFHQKRWIDVLYWLWCLDGKPPYCDYVRTLYPKVPE